MEKKPNWHSFNRLFELSDELKEYSWTIPKERWIHTFDLFNSEIKFEYTELLNKSNKLFNHLGGDPSNRDWSKFRPLRLSREEDWSDWLIHLIETSSTGIFSKNIFSISSKPQTIFINPIKCLREITEKKGKYRADLIINWNDRSYYHIEVKIGDPHLKKTFETSAALRKHFNIKKDNWTNFILILNSQKEDWMRIKNLNTTDEEIHVITWSDVSIALRKCIKSEESIIWKSWAYSFIGSIEQNLLNLHYSTIEHQSPMVLLEQISILTKAIANEK